MKKYNLYYFYGSPKTLDPNVKSAFINTLLSDTDMSDKELRRSHEMLIKTDLSHPKDDGFYLLDLYAMGCDFINKSVGEIAIKLLTEPATCITIDLDNLDDVTNEINRLEERKRIITNEINRITLERDKLFQEKSEIDNTIPTLRMKLKHLESPDPKCKEGDYVIYKSPYNGQKCVYLIKEVTLCRKNFIWSYKGCSIASSFTDCIHEENIISVISTKPTFKERDTVEFNGDYYTVKSVRYDQDKESWTYKIEAKNGNTRVTSWVYESEMR